MQNQDSIGVLKTELHQSITNLRDALTNLKDFVNRNDGDIRDKLGELDLKVVDLDNVVYGNNRQGTIGIIKRVENLEKLVENIEDARREERATLKGIKIGLALTGLTGAGTLVSILSQVLG